MGESNYFVQIRRISVYMFFFIFLISCAGTPVHESGEAPADIKNDAASTDMLLSQLLVADVPVDQRVIAVLPFGNVDGGESKAGAVISERLITAFVQHGRFSVVERALLDRNMEEMGLLKKGVVDEASAKEVGLVVGADFIVTGTVIDMGPELEINARMIDVEKGTILAASRVRESRANLPLFSPVSTGQMTGSQTVKAYDGSSNTSGFSGQSDKPGNHPHRENRLAFKRGRKLFEQGKYKLALEVFRHVEKAEGFRGELAAQASLQMAVCLNKKGRRRKAARVIKRTVRMYPGTLAADEAERILKNARKRW